MKINLFTRSFLKNLIFSNISCAYSSKFQSDGCQNSPINGLGNIATPAGNKPKTWANVDP